MSEVEKKTIKEKTDLLRNYIENESYKGYDPYDGLKSPLLKYSHLKSNKLIQFGIQQLVKRSPINLRNILNIKKGYNPVTLGLCIQAYSNLIIIEPEHKEELTQKCNFLIEELEKLIPEGYHGVCWGYDFDWAARYATIKAYQPNIVATGIITNSLFYYYQTTQNQKSLNLCLNASEFILKDIQRSYKGDNFFFSYSPFDKQEVFNATMKGVRLLSQVYSINKNESLKEILQKVVPLIIQYQQQDGSWLYSTSKTGNWIDNYHTAYILDCLDEYIKHTQDLQFFDKLTKGYNYYKNNFFEKNQIPKFYNNKIYPIDCTAAGQSLLTLCRFNDINLASNVALWMISNMQSDKGYFYFRKYKNFTIKTSFMRWSNAWMFVGLTELLKKLK